MVGDIFLIPSGWYIGLIILVIAGGILFFLVRWHSRNFSYRCPKCGFDFDISFFVDFISPHGGGKKYLKCPQCQKRSWAIEKEKIKR